MPEMLKRFEPAFYSLEELKFLEAHVGEPPLVALQEKLPSGVNPAAVRPVLDAVYDLEKLREARGIHWAGPEALKDSISKYLASYAADLEMHRMGAPRYPSMHTWDSRGRPHKGGTGADAKFVRTYFDENGERIPFGVDMIPSAGPKGTFTPPWLRKTAAADLPNDITEDEERGFVQCPLCGFAQNYNKASDTSRATARGRVAKHLKTYKGADEVRHRELYTHVFGGA